MDKQTNRFQKWLHPDVPNAVREHLIGPEHSARHKFCCGVAIMIMGISIVKGSMVIESSIVHFLADGFGYLIHGIGAIPIVKSLETLKGGSHE